MHINQLNVEYAYKSIKRDADHGQGIHIKSLDYIIEPIICFMTAFFDACRLLQFFPSVFKIGYMKPALKPKRDKHDKNSYREITLGGTFGKIYDFIWTTRSDIFTTQLELTNINNFAASKGKSTQDAILYMLNDIHESWLHHCPSYAILTDICECYPS
eukprot:362528_1